MLYELHLIAVQIAPFATAVFSILSVFGLLIVFKGE